MGLNSNLIYVAVCSYGAEEVLKLELNKIYKGDVLDVLKTLPDGSVDICITSPPYWGLRDYGVDGQLGLEPTYVEYLNKLNDIFIEVKRVLKDSGSCWVNIGDMYSSSSKMGVAKQSLMCLPDRFKINMVDSGWLCRNEIIWHKPNAMPSSAKTRFNTDYEKFYFFTKTDDYYFNTQYEESKTAVKPKKVGKELIENNSKYISIEQETSVRQGLNKSRGSKVIEVRPLLPTQKEFVAFLRGRVTIKGISNSVEDLKVSKVEHWFRKGKCFSYPSVEDWGKIKHLLDDGSDDFKEMDKALTYVEYETDDVNKNSHRGRLKRAVWSINTKCFRGSHFVSFPEELVEVPIKACCPPNGVVLDIFMGSGTTGVVAKRLGFNYVGIELNKSYIEVANNRIEGCKIDKCDK